ncbi:hypothetical protein PUR71_33245 [Streptomyces sp. SP17BM10]|uniref:hypothetical protein n=1 Tax=Streptomyces sp. SP17BM10 TaxID=3002530 RepID=UPI002E773399|nr:hypothetical protein [Streptomyces sp. SP17BM10]MEE1787738.1 hypothetical protein [Streptomyces sp. SP17BM10]
MDHSTEPGTATPADPGIYLMPPGYIAAMVDGRIVAVPEHTTTTAPTAAVPAAEPPAPHVPATDEGLSLAVRQYVLYGSIATLAAGGAVWMIGAGIGAVAAHADGLVAALKWLAVLVGVVVAGVFAVKAKIRSAGEGGTTTVALIHRERHTTIGHQRQTVVGRGSISNQY